MPLGRECPPLSPSFVSHPCRKVQRIMNLETSRALQSNVPRPPLAAQGTRRLGQAHQGTPL